MENKKVIEIKLKIHKNRIYTKIHHEEIANINEFKLKTNQKFIRITPTENDKLYKIITESKTEYKKGQKEKIKFFEYLFNINNRAEETETETEDSEDSEEETETETEDSEEETEPEPKNIDWLESYKNKKQVDHSSDKWLER